MAKNTEHRSLSCDLTEAEVKEKADQLASTIKAREEAEAARKRDADKHKDTIKTLDGHIAGLAESVRDRSERRLVECRWERDDQARKMICHRTDTGEVIEKRAMTDEELEEMQPTLFGVEGGKATRGQRRTKASTDAEGVE